MRSIGLLLNFKLWLSFFLDIVRCVNAFYDLKSTNQRLYEIFLLGSNFDGIAMKLGIISICPVAFSCYTSPSSSRVPREDDGMHLTSCVGQMPNNLPSGQVVCNILSYWADLYIIKPILAASAARKFLMP